MTSGRLSCQEAREQLAWIRVLFGQLEQAITEGSSSRNFTRSYALQEELRSTISQLEAAINPVERLLDGRSQYQSQLKMLEKTGVIENGAVMGIDGKRYPPPTFAAIQDRLGERRAELTHKVEQGFVKVLLVPIGISLQTLIDRYAAALKRHKRAGKLCGSKRTSTDPDLQGLNNSEPIWVWKEGYTNADVNGTLVYFPKQFDPTNHGGRTKQQLLTDPENPFPGWQVLLVEDLPNLPRQGKRQDPQKTGGRPQLEANQTPRQYLETIQTNLSYQGEEGFTPEAWLTLALTELEERNQVLDDWQGKGSAAYLTGAYFPGTTTSGNVPCAYWRRDDRQADLYWDDPGYADGYASVRVVVRV